MFLSNSSTFFYGGGQGEYTRLSTVNVWVHKGLGDLQLRSKMFGRLWFRICNMSLNPLLTTTAHSLPLRYSKEFVAIVVPMLMHKMLSVLILPDSVLGMLC